MLPHICCYLAFWKYSAKVTDVSGPLLDSRHHHNRYLETWHSQLTGLKLYNQIPQK